MTEAPAAPGSGRRTAATAFIFATLFLDMLAMGVIVPVLPKLVIAFEGGDEASAAHMVGLFGAAWALMQFVFSPILGALSDRFGRRPVLLLSLTGLGLDYILMALAPTLTWLFIGRIISGATAATMSTANAYIADVTPPDRRAAAFGLVGAAWGAGFIVGPALGGYLGGMDLRLPFWIAAGLTLANVLYGTFVLPESLPRAQRTPFRWRKANPVASLTLLGSTPGLAVLALIMASYFLALQSLQSVFVLYADHRYAWDVQTTGLCISAIGVGGVITQALVVRRAVRRFGERGTLLLGLTFLTLGYLGYGLASEGWMIWLALPLMSLGGLANPGLQGLASRKVGPGEQGRLQGSLGGVQGIVTLVGPLLFTTVFAATIPQQPGAAFFVAAALPLLGLALALRWTRG